MNEPDTDRVDALVAGHLQRLESELEVSDLLERIEADRSLSDETSALALRSDAGSWRRWWAGALTAAAVVLAAFVGGRLIQPASANAALLLRDVQTAHLQRVDRCYLVQYSPEADVEPNAINGASVSLLWTRGDRFWSDCAIGKTRLKIGRDRGGAVWFSPSRDKGIRFPAEPADLPAEVQTICQINALTVPMLVDVVLADFDLRTNPATTGRRHVVWAELKPGRSHVLVSAATMEIDPESDVVVRLVLWLHKQGRPNGMVTFSLVDRPSPGEGSYELRSHLDEDAVIEDKTFSSK